MRQNHSLTVRREDLDMDDDEAMSRMFPPDRWRWLKGAQAWRLRKAPPPTGCKWWHPTTDATCSRCGRPVTFVPQHMTKAGPVVEHHRHRRPIKGRKPHAPRKRGTDLTLSAPVCVGHAGPCSEALCGAQGHNSAFRQRAGARNRIVLPSRDEWAAFKAVAS